MLFRWIEFNYESMVYYLFGAGLFWSGYGESIMMAIRKIIIALSLSFLFFSLPVMASEKANDEAGEEAKIETKETKTADEVAKELANPNTALASIVFKNQFTLFTGDLPEADDQNSVITLFQPVLPFPLESGAQIIFRPIIPITWNAPAGNNFKNKTGIADISFDLVYAPKAKNGWITALGIVSLLPTATNDDLGIDKLTLGPDILFGRVTKEYVLGIHPSHQWDIGGSGDEDVSFSSAQLFGLSLLGKGWTIGTNPTITYDWEQSEWEIPINLIVTKTVIIGGRPWKFGTEFNYYVDQDSDFGPRWMFSFNITPVIENGLAKWFK